MGFAKIPGMNVTPKEYKVIKKITEAVKNGTDIDKSKIGLEIYHNKTKRNATTTVGAVLKKPRVIKALNDLLRESKLDIPSIASNLSKLANATPDKITGETVLKANIEAMKIHGVYPGLNKTNTNVNINVGVKDMSVEEIREALNRVGSGANELLSE